MEEKQGFFKTKAGGLTLAFIAIMAAFAMIMAGLSSDNHTLADGGFILMLLAMLYSPLKTYLLK